MSYLCCHWELLILSSSITIPNCQSILSRKTAYNFLNRNAESEASCISNDHKKSCVVRRTNSYWVQNTVSIRLHTTHTFNTFESSNNFFIEWELKRFYAVIIAEWFSIFSDPSYMQSEVVTRETFSESSPINF